MTRPHTRTAVGSVAINSKSRLFEIYNNGRYRSYKHDSYFQVYEEIFAKYVGREIIFVEIGVYEGGSLFMWREYLGVKARIIGIDLNPAAKQWEKDGFEIYIGNQSLPEFWDNFFMQVGKVDIVLDDGGHTNEQQIITAAKVIHSINNGGVLAVEDVHASYLSDYGNPSKYSFVNYAKHLVDCINSRCPSINTVSNRYSEYIHSITFYESIIVFNVDSRKCFVSSPTINKGVASHAEDFTYQGSVQGAIQSLQISGVRSMGFLKRLPLVRSIGRWMLSIFQRLSWLVQNHNLKRFFR